MSNPNSETAEQTQEQEKKIHLESFERITHLPVISTGLNLTSDLYGKVKGSSGAARLIFETAEHSVHKAAQLAEPVATTLQKPIEIADSMFCSTMDFVGNNITKVVEVQQKAYSKAVSSLPVQPAVDCVKTIGTYGVERVNHIYNKFHNSDVQDDENERDTVPEKQDRSTQTVSGNVHSKVKMYSK